MNDLEEEGNRPCNWKYWWKKEKQAQIQFLPKQKCRGAYRSVSVRRFTYLLLLLLLVCGMSTIIALPSSLAWYKVGLKLIHCQQFTAVLVLHALFKQCFYFVLSLYISRNKETYAMIVIFSIAIFNSHFHCNNN